MVYSYIFGVVLFLNLLLALFVFFKDRRNQVNLYFSLFIFSVIFWMLSNYLSNQKFEYNSAFFWNKLIFIFSPYISLFLFFFTQVFPSGKTVIKLKKLLLFALPVFISNFLTVTNNVIKGIEFLPSGGTGVVFAWGIYFFGAQFILYLFTSVGFLVKSYIKSEGIERLKMQYVLLGVSVLAIFGTITNFIVPLLTNNFGASDIGPLLSLFVFSFTAYSIVQHKLFDIKIIATQVLTILIIIALFVKLVLSQNSPELIVNALILLMVLIFGVLLVRSVKNEVKQRELLQELNDKLKELDKQKDEFVSMAAHELRSPLTAIKGYVSMVIEGDTGDIPEKARQYLADSMAVTERLVRLVNNMLNVSRIEEGRIVYQLEETSLIRAVQEIFNSSRVEAERKGLEIKVNIPNGVEDIVKVDPDRVREVVGNIVSNAIKFTEKGRVVISMSNPRPNIVKVEVADTGPGISAEEQTKLFQKFYRAESTSGKTFGTGLGLYITRLLVENFGGKMGLQSETDKGSNFWFELPCIRKV